MATGILLNNLQKKVNNLQVALFTLGELFCGPGGIGLGAINARVKKDGVVYKIRHGWANDIDEATCETYSANICLGNSESVICRDVRELDISSLSAVDAFAYGFPCNDFSIVGEKKALMENMDHYMLMESKL